MLNVMIVIEFVLWLIGFFIRGKLTLYQVLLIVPVVMFALRKVGIKISAVTIVVTEILFLFFSTVFTILFSSIDKGPYIACIVVRVISIIIPIIDDTLYVYVTEERKIR